MRHYGLVILLFLWAPFSLANEKYLAEAFKSFKTGSYNEALKNLKKVRGSKKVLGTRYYLEGLCHNRLQSFDESLIAFTKAFKFKNKSKDINYEYGQALYANSDLEEAGKAFGKSYKIKYKSASSLYYMGHISQLLEKHKLAKKYFSKLIKEEKKDKNLIQVAYFQHAESSLILVENDSDVRDKVSKKILPVLKKAKKILPKSNTATDIQKRIKEIERQYGLDPNVMINGKVLSEKRWSASISQEISYDSNITLATDVPTSQATQKDSYIFYSTLNADYLFNLAGRYTVKPHITLKNTYHGDRENSEVYQSDSYSLTGGFDNSLEHKLFGQQASFIFGIEHNYTARDRESKKEKILYARSWTFTLGEKFRYFSIGKSGIKFKYKDYKAYQDSLNNKTTTFSFDQVKTTKAGNLFIFFAQADFIDNYNDTSSSTNNYLFRLDYLMPKIAPKYTLNLAMSVAFLDTKEQSATRGTEKTYTPSIKITKSIGKNLSATMAFDYIKNTSLNKSSYEYTKTITNFEVKYNF